MCTFLLISGVYGQSPLAGNPRITSPPGAGLPPAPPPATQGIPPADPPHAGPAELQSPLEQCNAELQKTREELKHLAAEREQKRAEFQEVEVRYKEAQKRLADSLEKRMQVLLREVEMLREELRNFQGGENHTAAGAVSRYHVTSGGPPGGTPAISGAMPAPAASDQGQQWQRTPLPGQ